MLPVEPQTIPILVSEVTDPQITLAGETAKSRTAVEFSRVRILLTLVTV